MIVLYHQIILSTDTKNLFLHIFRLWWVMIDDRPSNRVFLVTNFGSCGRDDVPTPIQPEENAEQWIYCRLAQAVDTPAAASLAIPGTYLTHSDFVTLRCRIRQT